MPIEIPDRTPCPFCQNLEGANDCAFVHREERLCSFVNPKQYGKGALLVVPARHAPTILDLEEDEAQAIYLHARRLAQAVALAFDHIGLNIFQNNGVASGQTVPHFHLHIVPRYGDSDPKKKFREADYSVVPIEERLALADEIRSKLQDL